MDLPVHRQMASWHFLAGLALIMTMNNPLAAGRILTLSPHAADLVIAAGAADRIVGVSAFTDEAGLNSLPVVSDARGIDREQVLSLDADLAVVWRGGNRAADMDWLEKQGMRLFVSDPRQLDDIPSEIRQLSQLTKTALAAEHAALELESAIHRVRSRYADTSTTDVCIQLWRRPPIVLGGTSFISRALEDCGARNVFRRVPRESFTPDPETLAAVWPDVEIIPGGGPDAPALTAAAQSLRPAMDGLFQPGPAFILAWEKVCIELHAAHQAVVSD